MSVTFKLNQVEVSEYELFVLMHHGALRRCIARQFAGEQIPSEVASLASCDTHTLFEYAPYKEFPAYAPNFPVAA